MKVVENNIWFPAVHENSLMLKFEMCAPQLFLLLSRESGGQFYMRPSQGQFWQLSVLKLYIHYWEKSCKHFNKHKHKNNCGSDISNFNTNEFSWTNGNQMKFLTTFILWFTFTYASSCSIISSRPFFQKEDNGRMQLSWILSHFTKER